MSVSYTQEICDHAISSAGLDVGIHGFFTDTKWLVLVRIVGFEIG